MIGVLPATVQIGGREYTLNTDYRVALTVFMAIADVELTNTNKANVMMYSLLQEADALPTQDYVEACEKLSWYLDGGEDYKKKEASKKPVLDWEQDEQLIFSAINKVAGQEVRAVDYMHWWTFLGLFREIDEKSLITTVIGIRQKKNSGKKLDKHEQEFYRKNKSMIDIKRRYNEAEQAELDEINRLLGGG